MKLKSDWIRQIEDRAEAMVEGYLFSCYLFDQVQVPKKVPLGMIADVISQIRKEACSLKEAQDGTREAISHFQLSYDNRIAEDERIEFMGETEHCVWYRPVSVLVRVELSGDAKQSPEFSIPKFELSEHVVKKKVNSGNLLCRALLQAREYHWFDRVTSIKILQGAR